MKYAVCPNRKKVINATMFISQAEMRGILASNA